MPPRHFTNPPPKTESATRALQNFFCDLCQKGYARQNEFDAHIGSYEHQHTRRLKEMKQIQRDPNAVEKARRQERKENEKAGLISIKLDPTTSSTGEKKKGTFKRIGTAANAANSEQMSKAVAVGTGPGFKRVLAPDEEEEEDELASLGYEVYDPTRPTGCGLECVCKRI